MTPAKREAAERLADALTSWPAAFSPTDLMLETAALLRELAAEPVQAPVAWMAESKSGSVRFTNIGQSADELESLGWAIVPLYAAPQQRTPLSDEVVAKLINTEWATSDVPSAWKFARAIERAITGEPT